MTQIWYLCLENYLFIQYDSRWNCTLVMTYQCFNQMRLSVSLSTTASLIRVIMAASVFLSMAATSVLVSLVTEDQHVSLTSMSVPVILVWMEASVWISSTTTSVTVLYLELEVQSSFPFFAFNKSRSKCYVQFHRHSHIWSTTATLH